MSKTNKEILNELFQKYNLSRTDDIFDHKHYKIITRSGIDKIQAAANIEIGYTPIYHEFHDEYNKITGPNRSEEIGAGLWVAIKAKGQRFDDEGNCIAIIETFGEASPENAKQGYPWAMAEKRAMSRAVLKLAGLYEHGVFSEDEADEFGDAVRAGRRAASIK